jgi:transcriptional/translational regulatory protein YebC/TACO1
MIIKNKDMEFLLHKNYYSKVFGKIIKKLKASKKFNMANTTANFKMVKDVEKANSFGITENIIKENGKMAKSMAVDIGDQVKEKVILESGIMGKLQDMEYTQSKAGKNMKASLPTF